MLAAEKVSGRQMTTIEASLSRTRAPSLLIGSSAGRGSEVNNFETLFTEADQKLTNTLQRTAVSVGEAPGEEPTVPLTNPRVTAKQVHQKK